MVWVHGKVGLVTAGYKNRGAVFLLNIGQLKRHPHHAGVNASVLYAIAKNRIDLLRPAAVQIAVALALLSHHGESTLQANLRSDNFVQHLDHFGVINKELRSSAGHGALVTADDRAAADKRLAQVGLSLREARAVVAEGTSWTVQEW